MIRLWFLPMDVGLILVAQAFRDLESLNLSTDFDRSTYWRN